MNKKERSQIYVKKKKAGLPNIDVPVVNAVDYNILKLLFSFHFWRVGLVV